MPRTPNASNRRSSQRAKPSTPGDTSVTSSGSQKPGVDWAIQKSFAQELENAFPLAFCPPDGNSAQALQLSARGQTLSSFLDSLVEQDKDSFGSFGKRGSEIRKKLSDLHYYWCKKDKETYRRTVVLKLKIQLVKGRTPREALAIDKALDEDDKEEFSDVSFEDYLASPPARAKAAVASKTHSKKSENPIVGRTVSAATATATTSTAKSSSKMSSTTGTPNPMIKVLSDGTIQGQCVCLQCMIALLLFDVTNCNPDSMVLQRPLLLT